MSRHRHARRFDHRPVRPTVFIVTDDSRTAPAYFKALANHVRSRATVKVEQPASSKTTALHVLEKAKKLAKTVADFDAHDSVWALIDLEGEQARRDMATNACRSLPENVKVALSDPCFEVWTLAHLIDTGQRFQDCHAVNACLQHAWWEHFQQAFPNKKAQADYPRLMPFLAEARERAARRTQKLFDQRAGSWTEIHLVVADILDRQDTTDSR